MEPGRTCSITLCSMSLGFRLSTKSWPETSQIQHSHRCRNANHCVARILHRVVETNQPTFRRCSLVPDCIDGLHEDRSWMRHSNHYSANRCDSLIDGPHPRSFEPNQDAARHSFQRKRTSHRLDASPKRRAPLRSPQTLVHHRMLNRSNVHRFVVDEVLAPSKKGRPNEANTVFVSCPSLESAYPPRCLDGARCSPPLIPIASSYTPLEIGRKP